MSKAAEILRIDPQFGLAGGEIAIDCANFDTSNPTLCAVWFGGERAPIVALSPNKVLAVVPEGKFSGRLEVRLECGGLKSEPGFITIGRRLAEDLHPVSNPAFDPDDGALFVTRSGSRGEHLAVTLFRIDVNGDIHEFSGDIANPTGIAFDSSGQMFVTSRMDGTVYRVTPFKEAVPFARNLGVATGIAIDSSDTIYVGDRTGTIYKINSVGEEMMWAHLEGSVSAYHLAVGPDQALYVTGPTVGSFDAVMRVNDKGDVSTFYRGLGRPQGLAFDNSGALLVAASLRGRRGIVRITPDGQHADLYVAGINLVGLALGPTGDLAIVSTDSVYSLAQRPTGD